jgi:hypothetical protein
VSADHLQWYGWILAGSAIAVTAGFVARMVARDFQALWFHILVLAALWTLLIWTTT